MLLKKIKPNSASSPDSVSAWMLRSFTDVASPSIATLFNLSLRFGKLPIDWKSNVVPIPKGTNLSEVQFYRPISLLPLISRTLERHVQSFLLEHLNTMCFLSDSQFGFRSGCCTSTPLLIAVHRWHSFLERRMRVGCIFIDLKKAFNSVPHQVLLNKLSNLNLPPHLFAWLSDYFNLQFQRVILGGHSSSWSPVTSGVPKGSILSPLLFLVYVNDIFDLHLSPNANLMVYADDILLSKPITTSSDLTAHQSHLNFISDWLSKT